MSEHQNKKDWPRVLFSATKRAAAASGLLLRLLLAGAMLVVGAAILDAGQSLVREHAAIRQKLAAPLVSAWLRLAPSGRYIPLPKACVQYMSQELRLLSLSRSSHGHRIKAGSRACCYGDLTVRLEYASGAVIHLHLGFGKRYLMVNYDYFIDDPDYYYAPYLRPRPKGFCRMLCRAFSDGDTRKVRAVK